MHRRRGPTRLAVASVEGLPDWIGYVVITVVSVLLPGYLTGRYRHVGGV